MTLKRHNDISQAHLAAVVRQWQEQQQCRWLAVVGDSMWPRLQHGDTVLVEFTERRLHLGDIALIWPGPAAGTSLLLHRVVRIDHGGTTVITQGDNRLRADPSHARTAIRGIVIARRRARITVRLDRPHARQMARLTATMVRWSILPYMLHLAQGARRQAQARISITKGVTPHG